MRQIANILVYFEEQPDAVSLERCIAIARKTGAKLVLASVIKPARSHTLFARAVFDDEKVEQILVQERRSQFDDVMRQVPSKGVEISVCVYVGDPVEAIIEAVRSESHDLLVKLSHSAEGTGQPEFGSIDMRLMRRCPCTVVMMRTGTQEYSDCAVAALDLDEGDEILSDLNQEILDSMSLLAHKDFLNMKEIHIIHVWSVYGEQLLKRGMTKMPEEQFQSALNDEESSRRQWLQDLVDRYRSTLDETEADQFDPKILLLHGDPSTVIPQYVNEINADTLCMGTVSRSGISRFLMGNTAETVLKKVHCSVVTHKPRGGSAA